MRASPYPLRGVDSALAFPFPRATVRRARHPRVPLSPQDVPEAVERTAAAAAAHRKAALASPLADAVAGDVVSAEGWQLLGLTWRDQSVEVHDHLAR